MKKRSEGQNEQALTSLIGLGNLSTRKSYYPELVSKLDELEAEKNRYKWLFENAQHGIFQACLDKGVVSANPAIVKICRYQTAEQFSDLVNDLGSELFYQPESYEIFRSDILEHGKVFGFETLFRRADDKSVHVSINALLKENEGEAPSIEAFVQDITERKKNQDRLKRLNEELEERVENRTRELVTLNDKLWQEIAEREQIQKELKVAKETAENANQSKDKYLAAASHDLLQPMNAARLLIAALRERELQAQDSQLVERVHLALENAEDLLTDLLDISKLDQNAVNPDISEFRLSQLLGSMIGEFQPVAEDKGLELRSSCCSVVVRSDSRLLLRIIRNFISNAIRYTRQGKVLVGCRRQGDSVSIQVWDTGTGIPEDKRDEVFKEFQQLDCHTGQERQGVGLGLAIVERIAKMLGHKLQVHSVEGKGSMFAVEVPLVDQPVLQRFGPSFELPLQDQLHDLAVLVLDNEENILASMDALLTQWGCNVLTVASQAEAIERCTTAGFVPEIILADYHLDNDLLGTDAIMALRKHFELDIPGVMLTADRSTECRQMFRQMGLPVINKPVKPGKLRALLTHLV